MIYKKINQGFVIVCLSVLWAAGCGGDKWADIKPFDAVSDEDSVSMQEEDSSLQEEGVRAKKNFKKISKNTLEKFSVERNPFLTGQEQNDFFEKLKKEARNKNIKKLPDGPIIIKNLTLSAIFHSDVSSNSYAIVQGRIVKENDNVNDMKIIRIDPEELVMKNSVGKEYLLKIKNVIYRKL